MNGVELILGLLLMLTGVLVITAAVFRALGHAWNFGLYELWALPTVGICFILLGHWLLQ